jgi:hypothetical protein
MDVLDALFRLFRAVLSRLGTVRHAEIPFRQDTTSHESRDVLSNEIIRQTSRTRDGETKSDSLTEAPLVAAISPDERSDKSKSAESALIGSVLDTTPVDSLNSPVSVDDATPESLTSVISLSTAPTDAEPVPEQEPESIEHSDFNAVADITKLGQIQPVLPEPLGVRKDNDAPSQTATQLHADSGNDNKPPKGMENSERRPRSTPQPRAQISHEPFAGGAPSSLPSEYARWNTAIAQHCFFADGNETEDVYISVTPRILAAAFSEVSGEVLDPETTQLRFTEAVSAMYHERVLTHPRQLRVLRREGHDGMPECTAFLALSVLAAFEMHADEESSAAAYYVRLADLIRTDLIGGRPRGFELDEFEALWHYIRAWLNENRRRNLAMPGADVGLRRFVALPLAHVPLRKVDIERLPEFFSWSAYEPFCKVAHDRLDTDLAKWSRGRAVFTNAGTAALVDERRSAVLAQVAHELECWDGSHTDPQGRRSTIVEIFLESVRRRPELFYLPRRPDAFPNTFDDGIHTFDSGEGGWYSPLPVDPVDGNDLHTGFSWETTAGNFRVAMRRPDASVIALAPSEFSGFISHRGLPLGALTAVLCHDTVLGPTAEYLTRITGQRSQPTDHVGIPTGWRLFTGIKPIQQAPTPEGLGDLEVEHDIQLVPIGGLRLGRRWAWLSGAPPKLLLTGIDSTLKPTIDGEPVEIGADGVINDGGRLTRPGVRIVEVGRLRRRVEIVEAEMTAQAKVVINEAPKGTHQTAIAIPRGLWFVLGTFPGEAVLINSGQWEGSLLNCPFHAVWAVSVGSGPGAVALCLVDTPPPPEMIRSVSGKREHRCAETWASSIYNAAIRRPRIAAAYGAPTIPQLAEVWALYVEKARQVKRALRARRK